MQKGLKCLYLNSEDDVKNGYIQTRFKINKSLLTNKVWGRGKKQTSTRSRQTVLKTNKKQLFNARKYIYSKDNKSKENLTIMDSFCIYERD